MVLERAKGDVTAFLLYISYREISKLSTSTLFSLNKIIYILCHSWKEYQSASKKRPYYDVKPNGGGDIVHRLWKS